VKGLKLLNSINSIEFGDEVLIRIAEILRSIYETDGAVARVSGGEFVLWIENVLIEDIDKHIKDLLKVLDQQLRSYGIDQKIELYMSYAASHDIDETVERCYQKATLALGYAKSLKCLTVTSYNEEMEKKAKYDILIGDMVSEAIKEWEFKVVYQTKIDVATGKIFGVEALARWESKILGKIPPNIFIPIIEKNNMSVNFGNKMIEMVLNDMSNLQKKYGEQIVVSINISPSHFITKGFKEQIIQEVTRRNISPNQILLEMTEEIMIAGFDIAEGVIMPLREFGIGISLDDFGTGYSSLSYFAKMDFNELKIDKSFIDQIHETNKIRALIKSIIQLAELYGVDVVAEGVETKEQLDILVDLGCHLIQGYYFSKPESIN